MIPKPSLWVGPVNTLATHHLGKLEVLHRSEKLLSGRPAPGPNP